MNFVPLLRLVRFLRYHTIPVDSSVSNQPRVSAVSKFLLSRRKKLLTGIVHPPNAVFIDLHYCC